MFPRWFHYLFNFLQFPRARGLTREELEDMDVGVSEVLTVFDMESLQVQDGDFVGATAIVEDKDLVMTRGQLPRGYGISSRAP
jgi:hypothetical protein